MPATTARKAPKPAAHTSDATSNRMDGDIPQPMAAEEYLALPERINGYTYELAQGALVVREPPPFWGHSRVKGNLYLCFRLWMEKFGHGEAAMSVGCLISERPDTMRTTDVTVLLRPFDPEKAFHGRLWGAPDIAVEVLSPLKDPKQIRDKTADYFKAGARRVWIVDPETRTVVIHKADGTSALFEEKNIIEDPEVLPGFALEARKIFEI